MYKVLLLLIVLFILTPALGMSGGILLSIWKTGLDLQPVWVKVTNVIALLSLVFAYIKSLVPYAYNSKWYEHYLFLIIGLVLMPMVAGFVAKGGIFDFAGNTSTPFDGAVEQLSKYLPVPFNFAYILKIVIIPLWEKFPEKPESKNNELP